MANGRHSYIAFYPSDWLGGTARMRSRIMRSIYFDVCLYNWDTAKPCPPIELAAMLGDVPDWQDQVDQLVAMEKLVRNADGSIENPKAMAEAAKSLAAWEAMSRAGKARQRGAESGAGKGADNPPGNGAATEPEPEPETSIEVSAAPPHVLVFNAWNVMAKAAKLPTAAKLTEPRARHIKARIKDNGVEAIVAAIAGVPGSAFLMGKNDRGWRANLDDMLRPANMAKLIDGGYHAQGETAEAKRIISFEEWEASTRTTIGIYRKMGRSTEADDMQRQLDAAISKRKREP